MAFADPDVASDLAQSFSVDASAAQSMRDQAEALQDQLEQWQDQSGGMHFGLTPQQAEEFRKQAEQFRDGFKGQSFGIDQKQMDELKKQMEQFHQNLKPEDFKLDQQLLGQQLLNQFHQIQAPTFDDRMREQLKQQMDHLTRQMGEMQAMGFDHLV
jgi:hypothetical protein